MQTHAPQPPAPTDRLPLIAVSIAMSSGTLVLLGWLSNHILLATVLPDLPATHPLTALWLLLVGCAMALLATRFPAPWPKRSAVVLMSFVLITSSLTLSDYLVGWL